MQVIAENMQKNSGVERNSNLCTQRLCRVGSTPNALCCGGSGVQTWCRDRLRSPRFQVVSSKLPDKTNVIYQIRSRACFFTLCSFHYSTRILTLRHICNNHLHTVNICCTILQLVLHGDSRNYIICAIEGVIK
jgi:hypothetical protein